MGIGKMIFVLMLTPYALALLIIRPYFEFECLRKRHSKTYIRKNNKGNWLQRLLFWRFRHELSRPLYGLFLASFVLPVTVPPIYLAAGEDGLGWYNAFCLVLFVCCNLMALAGRVHDTKFFMNKTKGIRYRAAVDIVITLGLSLFLLAAAALFLMRSFKLI